MQRRLTINLERADHTGTRRVVWDLDLDGYQFYEQENGVLVVDDDGAAGGEGSFITRYNPNAWQSYTLEVIDD